MKNEIEWDEKCDLNIESSSQSYTQKVSRFYVTIKLYRITNCNNHNYIIYYSLQYIFYTN